MCDSIQLRFKAAKTQRNLLDGDEFFSDGHKKLREWLVLGAARENMQKYTDDVPEFASENLRPDFLTYNKDGHPWHPIEITDALRPGYRRHERFKKAKEEGPQLTPLPKPLKDPWKSLRQEITKKASKGYPEDTCLIVYLGIWVFDFDDWDRSVLDRLKAEHAETPFQDIDTFSRVFVLNSGMDDILELGIVGC